MSSSGGSNNNDQMLDWGAMSLSSSNFQIGGGRVDGSFFITPQPHNPVLPNSSSSTYQGKVHFEPGTRRGNE